MENTFEVTSGVMVCSDPCYSIPTWCQGIVENVKKGTWIASVIRSDEGDWGDRIAMLQVHHIDNNVEPMVNMFPMDFVGGVDSGQFGFFDKDFYRNDESAKDLPKYNFSSDFDREDGDAWYRACAEKTLGDESWGVLPNGVVSTSGFGDGSYEIFGEKDGDEYVGFAVMFIAPELDENEMGYDTCDDCGEEYPDCTCE